MNANAYDFVFRDTRIHRGHLVETQVTTPQGAVQRFTGRGPGIACAGQDLIDQLTEAGFAGMSWSWPNVSTKGVVPRAMAKKAGGRR